MFISRCSSSYRFVLGGTWHSEGTNIRTQEESVSERTKKSIEVVVERQVSEKCFYFRRYCRFVLWCPHASNCVVYIKLPIISVVTGSVISEVNQHEKSLQENSLYYQHMRQQTKDLCFVKIKCVENFKCTPFLIGFTW